MTWSPTLTLFTPAPTSTHDPGALMAQNGRKQALRIGARQGELVRVADAGRHDLHQHFAGAGAFELDRLDFQWLA